MGAVARIRNISSTGRRNRFYGSLILFSCAIIVNFVYLIVGEPPMLTPNYNPTILLLTVVILSEIIYALVPRNLIFLGLDKVILFVL